MGNGSGLYNKSKKEKSDEFDPQALADELRLTETQRKFADYFVFLTGLDGPKAVELAGYKLDVDTTNYKDDRVSGYYKSLKLRTKARELLNNPKILRYIKEIRDNLDKQLIVDKLWVIQKLKNLADSGSERTQLEATKLLGQYHQLFTEVQRYEIADDPSKIIQEAMERRKGNVIPFNKVEEQLNVVE